MLLCETLQTIGQRMCVLGALELANLTVRSYYAFVWGGRQGGASMVDLSIARIGQCKGPKRVVRYGRRQRTRARSGSVSEHSRLIWRPWVYSLAGSIKLDDI